MALLGASVIIGLIFVGTPAKTEAATRFDWYVNTNARQYGDNKSCSNPEDTDLQDVLNMASEGDTIMVCAGRYYGPFYTNNESITLVGQGAKKTIIDGNEDGDPAIVVGFEGCGSFCTGDLSIEALTITNGWADGDVWPNGGAVWADDFSCRNSVISYSWADGSGGAVDADTVTSYGCTYKYNGADVDGGAIMVYDWIDSTRDIFTNNQSGDDGGAVEIDDNGYDSTFDKATFTDNTACEDYYSECDEHSTWGGGGAISSSSGESYLYISSSTFTSNSSSADGGAIKANYVRITKSRFVDNYANNNGGAVSARDNLDLYSVTFTGNYAEGIGGALHTYGSLYMAGTKLSGNIGDDAYDGGFVEDYAVFWKGNSNNLLVSQSQFIYVCENVCD